MRVSRNGGVGTKRSRVQRGTTGRGADDHPLTQYMALRVRGDEATPEKPGARREQKGGNKRKGNRVTSETEEQTGGGGRERDYRYP
jgi:hypothetical protein